MAWRGGGREEREKDEGERARRRPCRRVSRPGMDVIDSWASLPVQREQSAPSLQCRAILPIL
jgi:hypothetical protein